MNNHANHINQQMQDVWQAGKRYSKLD